MENDKTFVVTLTVHDSTMEPRAAVGYRATANNVRHIFAALNNICGVPQETKDRTTTLLEICLRSGTATNN